MKSTLSHFTDLLTEEAFRCGFSGFGITGTGEMKAEADRFRNWLSRGMHGEMRYLEKNIEKRFNPSELMHGARSVIMLAMPFGDALLSKSNRTGIALYAWGEDYHRRLRREAQPLLTMLADFDHDASSRFFTDTAPLAERSLAARAGLGWIGRNGTLLTQSAGSMVWLCGIITTLQLPLSTPREIPHCGNCRRCVDACPTQALQGDGLVDANRCIAYHTNSSHSPVPEHIIPSLSGYLFGCDICQEVCPYNDPSGTMPTAEPVSYPAGWPANPAGWHEKTREWFEELFEKSALANTGFERLMYQAELLIPKEEQ